MYNKFAQNFISVKKSGDMEQIRNALIGFCDDMLHVLQMELNLQTFAEFAKDEKMIFKSVSYEFNNDKPDAKIESKGLLCKLSEMISLNNSELICNEIGNLVMELHLSISKGDHSKEKLKSELKEILLQFKSLLRQKKTGTK